MQQIEWIGSTERGGSESQVIWVNRVCKVGESSELGESGE